MWRAAQICLTASFGSVAIDMTAALALTAARGVPPQLSADLLEQFQLGLFEGRADQADHDEQQGKADVQI